MIEVDHLSKVYGATPAIRDVSFQVEAGEILGFLGPNGAGKTTTMRILAGYLPATTGTARVAGYDVHENSMAVRQRIGYLPETPPLYLEMTVEGFLDFVARIKGVSAGDRSQKIEFALRRCNLLEKRKTLIRKLSKGFRQRVGIAQAIVHDPPAIILDEPTVGLDPRQIIDVRNLIKSLAGDHTVILSTHILPEVSMTCDRVAIINRGEVVATNTPENLMAQLTGGIGYELELAGDIAVAQQVLEAIPGVRSVHSPATPQSPLPTGHHHLHVTLDGGAELGRELASRVVGAGLGLYEMKRVQVSLEAVFLELTTEEKMAIEPGTRSEAEEETGIEPNANQEESETKQESIAPPAEDAPTGEENP
ncbi:MAG: ABC transporter ATP-binding protein [Leptolyngbyaceae cyanobacterium bins.59]|nr:ABC transporter ATP-binding protein [Leptolyngbyaceae cyanobacterium bins.59]